MRAWEESRRLADHCRRSRALMEQTLVRSLSGYSAVCALARVHLNGILIESSAGTVVGHPGACACGMSAADFLPSQLQLLGETLLGDLHHRPQLLRKQRHSELLDHPAQLLELLACSGQRRLHRESSQSRREGLYLRRQLRVALEVTGKALDAPRDGLQ